MYDNLTRTNLEFAHREAEKRIAELEKENAELERKLEQTEKDLADYQFNYPTIKELQKENAELKSKLGLSIECDKAQKDGELCLGYGGYEEEPCEQCKNCIKCECGYYQLGETEKDDQLIKAKEILRDLYFIIQSRIYYENNTEITDAMRRAEQCLV